MAQSEKTKETGAKEDAAQADAARDSAQAAADAAGKLRRLYYVVLDDESDYEEFLRPGRRQKRRAVFGNSSAAAFRDGISV